MASLWAKQPLKAIYLLFFVPVDMIWTVLIAILYGILKSGRPHSTWTLRQAVAVPVVKSVLKHLSTIQIRASLSLEGGREGKRFVVMRPADAGLYKGPMNDTVIKPTPIGATWTPMPPQGANWADRKDAYVVLHFHGGAYVTGDGRDHDTGYLAKTLLRNMGCTYVCTPQYRLSDVSTGRFPAALQDALSSYLYLLHHFQIPASRIVLSGDSAGGNLALALLRYIAEFGPEMNIPWPVAATLWSPWCDVAAGLDAQNILGSPNFLTDYIGPEFGQWGASAYTAGEHVSASDRYISPLNNAFKSKTPIWLQTCGKEVLFDQDHRMAEQFRETGTTVELVVEPDCPHDIILVGKTLGFDKEAARCAGKAGTFVRIHMRD